MIVHLVAWVPMSILAISALLAVNFVQHQRHEAERRAMIDTAAAITAAEVERARDRTAGRVAWAESCAVFWQRQAVMSFALCQRLRRNDGDDGAVLREQEAELADWRAIAESAVAEKEGS